MKTISAAISFLGAVALVQPANAQFAKPEDAIKYRQSALYVMQQNFSRVAAMAAGKTPFDAKVAAESAANADFVSRLAWAGFGAGTDKGRDNRAKAEIWSDKARFNDYAEKLQVEMAKLNAAAKTANLDNVKVAVGGVGSACKTCHDAFRKD